MMLVIQPATLQGEDIEAEAERRTKRNGMPGRVPDRAVQIANVAGLATLKITAVGPTKNDINRTRTMTLAPRAVKSRRAKTDPSTPNIDGLTVPVIMGKHSKPRMTMMAIRKHLASLHTLLTTPRTINLIHFSV